jgi:hypothetical protein
MPTLAFVTVWTVIPSAARSAESRDPHSAGGCRSLDSLRSLGMTLPAPRGRRAHVGRTKYG